jgi:hypothetical protein
MHIVLRPQYQVRDVVYSDAVVAQLVIHFIAGDPEAPRRDVCAGNCSRPVHHVDVSLQAHRLYPQKPWLEFQEHVVGCRLVTEAGNRKQHHGSGPRERGRARQCMMKPPGSCKPVWIWLSKLTVQNPCVSLQRGLQEASPRPGRQLAFVLGGAFGPDGMPCRRPCLGGVRGREVGDMISQRCGFCMAQRSSLVPMGCPV